MKRNLLALSIAAWLLVLPQIGDAQNSRQFNPGAYPYYEAPPTSPGVTGARIYLMPDGGTWTIGSPIMPGVLPPPVYTPPSEPRETVINNYYYNDRRDGRRR